MFGVVTPGVLVGDGVEHDDREPLSVGGGEGLESRGILASLGRAHAFLCMLATYLTFHLRESFAPLTFTDTEPPGRPDPAAAAPRSASARSKDATKKNPEGAEVRGYREVLEHLGTLTRNTLRVVGSEGVTFDLLATPTPTQRRVFELLGVPVPRRLR